MPIVFEIVALASAALFAGAAAYVTLVEHPARVSCGTAIAVAEFRPSYRRGAVMQFSRSPGSRPAWWRGRETVT